ncbi:MAG: ATP-dependent DNA helicase RecG [Lachnospiraceae bacterium]|nr:ATP-dependent DNA helicase RecG [Lachnospiraceae bacterium]
MALRTDGNERSPEQRQAYLRRPLTDLKGVGEKTAALFEKVGVTDLAALLQYYPRTFSVFGEVTTVDQLRADTMACVSCIITGNPFLRKGRGVTVLTVSCGDETGNLQLVWFNAPFLRNHLKPGRRYVFRGMARRKGKGLVLQQPSMYAPEEYASLAGSMQPVYPLTKGLTNNTVMKSVRKALDFGCYKEETLPEELLQEEGLIGIRAALFGIHFPKNEAEYVAARNRLAFEEFYDFIRKLRALKEENDAAPNAFPCIETAETVRFLEALPYRLTKAQTRVWEEIREDLCGAHQMNRLIQGDVGSGKTVVAFLALLLCATNGYQGAIMAPTAVLAAQHFATFQKWGEDYGLPVRPVLLTGSMGAKDRREALADIADGSCNLIVGTHALFQEAVTYQKLALVVTDEQHRFGVRQREALEGKSVPHILSMSATPIPRTLAIILYGDLHVSLLDEAPAKRLPIKNAVVNTSYREKAWQMIVKEVREGHQAYVICPMIEPGEMEGLTNVTEYAEELRDVLPSDIRISLLHGQMKAKEKDRVMEEYAAHLTDVLVSTTVVEVGVDVPNATVMMIEDAQRFGLAQLHQLRGRVGRGEAQSYCIFVDTSPQAANGAASERLGVMKDSNDGFHIAEEDLKLRGPGELFGLRQSGALAFRIADIYRDAALLTRAAARADRM